MIPRVLLIDNYDSFTHNLFQALAGLGAVVEVVRNDAVDLEKGNPTHLVISPGPGRPDKSGKTLAAIHHFSGRIPVLGVCLGQQAIALAFGGHLGLAPAPVHGKVSEVHHDGRGLFRGLPDPFPAARYHSLAVSREGLPPELEVSAWTADGVVMGLRHRTLPVEGVQFHPESFMTPEGPKLLASFLGGHGGLQGLP